MTKNDKKDIFDDTLRSWKSNIALGVIGTSFVGTILLISPFITMQLKSPLPYMATPRKKVIDALENITKLKRKSIMKSCDKSVNKNNVVNDSSDKSGGSKKLRYYDLGSGDGETVLAAGSCGWKATGIELNRTLWALSSIRRLASPPQTRRNSNFKWGNMWDHSIHDADAVMIFGK